MNHDFRLALLRLVCLIAFLLCVNKSTFSYAEDPPFKKTAEETDVKGRVIWQELNTSADIERGWFRLEHATYWPLCYEPLDQLAKCSDLVGQSKPQELAQSLEKCSAWLNLSAAAAMTDGKAGIGSCASRLRKIAKQIRSGATAPTDETIEQCIALSEICIAKSHVLRANAPNLIPVPNLPKSGKSSERPRSKFVHDTALQINAERMKANRVQFLYDAIETVRHLSVARTYLAEAAKRANFTIPESVNAKLTDYSKFSEEDDITGVFENETMRNLRETIDFIEQKREEMKEDINE